MSQLDQLSALIASAGLIDFRPTSPSYRCDDNKAQLVPVSEIQGPPARTLIVQERANAVLAGISQDTPLPAVEVDEPPAQSLGGRRYRLRDGFHRYHLSCALGFSHIPVAVKPHLDLNDL